MGGCKCFKGNPLYPLHYDDSLNSLSGQSWFSMLDLASGYWQVKLSEDLNRRLRSLRIPDYSSSP